MGKLGSAPSSARALVLVGGALASFAADASDFGRLAVYLFGAYGIAFILIYAFTWKVVAAGIDYIGGKLFVHAAVLGFFFAPTFGEYFPVPAGLMLVTGEDRQVALTSIVACVLFGWIAAWVLYERAHPAQSVSSPEAGEPSDRQ
ncbi:hypothetical protein [Pseudomonas sp. CGJS7]|uniref:hypothetical protein n=1 Tax=Pseudomonas sp. CGJS7 TaxID=3109348 RepID=UPI003007FD0D